MLIGTLTQALRQEPVLLTRHRIDLISRLVCALIEVRSVHLKKLACGLSEMAKLESSYRRIQRFFSSNGSSAVFTPLLASKLVRPDQPQGLVLERTHSSFVCAATPTSPSLLAASTHTLPRGTTRFDLHTTLFNGVPLHLVWHRPTRGEVLLLITNQTDLLHILDGYGQRWAIETAVGFLKSKGLNLEESP